jgi:hypothetical protein
MNDELNLPLPVMPWLGYDPERGDLHGYSYDQMREYARAAVEAETHRCSQLTIHCSWEVVGAKNTLLVEALDEAIRAGR